MDKEGILTVSAYDDIEGLEEATQIESITVDTRKGRLTVEEKEQMRQELAQNTIKKAEISDLFKKKTELEELVFEMKRSCT